jgi:hypothetical protein
MYVLLRFIVSCNLTGIRQKAHSSKTEKTEHCTFRVWKNMRRRYTIHCDENGEHERLFGNGGTDWKERVFTDKDMLHKFDVL